jgi:hypothetical protein
MRTELRSVVQLVCRSIGLDALTWRRSGTRMHPEVRSCAATFFAGVPTRASDFIAFDGDQVASRKVQFG